MKIGFVCREYPPAPHGGIGTFVQMLARELVRQGHEAFVSGIYAANSQLPAYEEDEGVRVWRLPAPRFGWGGVAERFRQWRHVRHLGREFGLDAIEVPDWEGWCAAWPRLAAPVVVRLHGSASYFAAETGHPYSPLAYKVERWALRRADAWCSVSRYTADKTQALFALEREPATVLYNPVEPYGAGVAANREANRVVFSGTLTAKKGIVPLVRAWPLVREKRPHAELHLFGKDGRTDEGGSMRAHLENLLGNAAAQGVTFHGHVSRGQLFENLASCRLAVFPSYAEAFAIAPLEAMATGCPVVVTSRGSGPELISHGENGLLVDPDSTSSLAEGILQLLADDSLAARLGAQGQAHVRENFGLARLCRDNVAFYEQCQSQFSSRSGTLCGSR